MAEGAFHRGDRDRRRALPVDETNGCRFGEVARGRRSRVGVDVIDLIRSELGVVERGAHRAGAACAVWQWCDWMICVIRRAESEDLGVNARAAVHGML